MRGPGDPGPLLSRTEMDHAAALALCREILTHPRCEVLISGTNTSYLCPKHDDIITLYNEERDVDEDFYHLATLDVDDKWFVVLKPVEELPDIAEDEVLIYEVRDGEDGDVFVAIEDEALLQKVFDEFMAEVESLEDEEGEE